jgi:hypothetical protein
MQNRHASQPAQPPRPGVAEGFRRRKHLDRIASSPHSIVNDSTYQWFEEMMLARVKSAILCLGFAVFAATSAPAATLSFWLSAPVLGGPLDGAPLDLLISYDDSALTTGNEVLSPLVGNLMVSLEGFPGFEMVDVDYPEFPELRFADFGPVAFDFLIDVTSLPELAFSGILAIRVAGDVMTSELFPLFATEMEIDGVPVWVSNTTVELAAIPLPAGLPLLAGGLGLLLLAAGRRARR